MRRRGTSGTPWRISSLRILLQPILQHSAHNLHPGVLNWTQLNRTEFCGFCPRVGRKYHLPSRLPPGCFLLSTLDRDQVNTGEETSVLKGAEAEISYGAFYSLLVRSFDRATLEKSAHSTGGSFWCEVPNYGRPTDSLS